MSFIDDLRTELTTDPLTVGYSGMTDVAAAVSLNDDGTGRTLPVNTLSASEIYEAIDTAEFAALTAGQKSDIDRILSLGSDIVLTSSSKARAMLTAVFGAGTASRTAIVAKVSRAVSRAQELGLPTVKAGHVQMARA